MRLIDVVCRMSERIYQTLEENEQKESKKLQEARKNAKKDVRRGLRKIFQYFS